MLFEFGDLCLDDQRFTLTGAAGPVHIEPQVFGVLHHLIANRDRVVPKEELLDAVWGDRFVSESALSSRIKAARRAVGDDGSAQRIIKTVHGRGYQFVADVHTATDGARRSLAPLRTQPVGRDEDIKGVIGTLRAAPVVTIIGPGGVGKTTLALAVAHQLQPELADGAVFVDLATVPALGDVTGAVAEAAGVEGAASSSLDGLAAFLANRPVLLVLDNCEHVLTRAADLVDRVLGAGRAATVLATSREPLRVAGEHVWPLDTLGDTGPVLFVERARAAEPRIAWDAGDPRVVELCRRLDNVPLALELAAGQLRRFELDELIRRLEHRLTLLARQGATGDQRRHDTMEAAIDWSYQLLGGEEQELLRHLSVFPASFDLYAAEASAPPSAATEVAALFGGLVDKSLVVREPGRGRYRLLETIRAFARGHLEQAGEAAGAIERHRQHVRRRVGSTSRLDRWLSATLAAAFRADLHDARQSFQVSRDGGDVGDALEIAAGAAFLWRNALGCNEGAGWVQDLLNLDPSPADRLWVQVLRADVGQGRGDHLQLFRAAASAQRIAAETDDVAGTCVAAHYRALARLTDPDAAPGHLAPAVELAHAAGDARLVTLMEAFLTVATIGSGDAEGAHARFEVLASSASTDGYDRFIVNWGAWLLGLAERDAAEARRWMSKQQEFLDGTGIVETWLTSFSAAMCEVAERGNVREQLARTLTLADREGYRADADCVLALAYSEICDDRFEPAAELVGTAIRAGFNATANQVLYHVVLDHLLRHHLDASRMAEAIVRGQRRSAADALAEFGITSTAHAPAPAGGTTPVAAR